MVTRRRHVAALALALVTAAATTGLVGGVAQAGSATQTLAGSLAPAISSSSPTGQVGAAQQQKVQIWLAGDQSAAQAYATAVSTPGSADYHHYLSPAQATARFGASSRQVGDVSSWLRSAGFSDVTVSAQRSYVSATASTGTVDHAFGVVLRTYRHTDAAGHASTFQSNDREIALPAGIAGSVLAVSGLNSAQPTLNLEAQSAKSIIDASPTPAAQVPCSQYYGQHYATGVPEKFGSTRFPTDVCGYNGGQIRSAYGMSDAATGTGVSVAYVEIGTPYKMFATLQRFASQGGLPRPKSSHYRELAIGRGDRCGNPFDVEEQLDIEAGYAMAPDQNQILIGGDSCDIRLAGLQSLFDGEQVVLDGNGAAPMATIMSNSWGFGDEESPVAFSRIQHALLLRGAAEGVGMYFASGDGPGLLEPAVDPYAISVGGTSLAIDRQGRREWETGWSSGLYLQHGAKYLDFGLQFAAGGGTSLAWTQPDYQAGVVPTRLARPPVGDRGGLDRTSPDIAALADPLTGMFTVITENGADFGEHGDIKIGESVGGTSLATPLVAGIMAAAQQGQPTPFGFSNPAFYSLYGSAALYDVLPVPANAPADRKAVYCYYYRTTCLGAPRSLWTYDEESSPLTSQKTLPGYDTMTGIGVPYGQAFIDAVRGTA